MPDMFCQSVASNHPAHRSGKTLPRSAPRHSPLESDPRRMRTRIHLSPEVRASQIRLRSPDQSYRHFPSRCRTQLPDRPGGGETCSDPAGGSSPAGGVRESPPSPTWRFTSDSVMPGLAGLSPAAASSRSAISAASWSFFTCSGRSLLEIAPDSASPTFPRIFDATALVMCMTPTHLS